MNKMQMFKNIEIRYNFNFEEFENYFRIESYMESYILKKRKIPFQIVEKYFSALAKNRIDGLKFSYNRLDKLKSKFLKWLIQSNLNFNIKVNLEIDLLNNQNGPQTSLEKCANFLFIRIENEIELNKNLFNRKKDLILFIYKVLSEFRDSYGISKGQGGMTHYKINVICGYLVLLLHTKKELNWKNKPYAKYVDYMTNQFM